VVFRSHFRGNGHADVRENGNWSAGTANLQQQGAWIDAEGKQMSRQFDPDHIDELAKKVTQLKDVCIGARGELGEGDSDSGGAFGSLKNAASAGETINGFYGKVNAELKAAENLVDSASLALTEAALRMRNDEAEGVRTFGGGSPEQA